MELENVRIEDAVRGGLRISMKKLSASQRGDIVAWLEQGMRTASMQVDSAYLFMGMCWHFATLNKLYRYWGSHIKNANDLVRELNIGIGRPWLDHCKKVWQVYGKYLVDTNITPPVSRLVQALPMITHVKDPEEKAFAVQVWANKAMDLPREAWVNEVRVAKGKTPTDTCDHPLNCCEIWQRCTKCEKFWKGDG